MNLHLIPPIVIGRRAVDQVVIGTIKKAGYYLIDVTRCGKSIHLGLDRWLHRMKNKTRSDVNWNHPYYTTQNITIDDDIAQASDYIIVRYGMYSKFYAGRNKRRLKKMIPASYYLEVKNRTLIHPR